MAHNQVECISLVQRAINILQASQDWENRAMLRAQTIGLQGEKRRNRSDEHDELHTMQKLQCMINDRFDVEVFPEKQNPVPMTINGIPEFFTAYQAKLWEMIEKLHTIANDLVVAKYKVLAEPLYCYVEYLDRELVDTRRQIKEYGFAKWEYHHISRYQVGYENRHDDYAKKEKDY